MVVSINIDGPTLMAIQQYAPIRQLIAQLPWVRFELTKHQAPSTKHQAPSTTRCRRDR
nr:hypothetical protein [Candidatus Pantoea persica]